MDYFTEIENPNEAYAKFLYDFSTLYEEAFLKLEIKIKQTRPISPWITKEIIKSSKQKQILYNKFLKSRTKEYEANYKAYKSLFKTIRKKSKRTYSSDLFAKYKNNMKNILEIMNEIIGNTKNTVINNATVAQKQEIVENLDKFFTNVGPILASKMHNEQGGSQKYLTDYNTFINGTPLTDEESRKAYFSFQRN